MARRTQTNSSGGTLAARNFGRLSQAFPRASGGTATLPGGTGIGTASMDGQHGWGTSVDDGVIAGGTGSPATSGAAATGAAPYGYGQPPGGLAPGRITAGDQAPLLASEVFNKVAILAALAIGAGALSFVMQVSAGMAMVAIFAAFGIAMVASFRPHTARVLAPIYAVVEGLALGVISRFYSATSHGVVPMAVIFTGVVFMGTLGAYRSGLVRVTNRFVSMTMVLTLGIVAVFLASMFGVPVPGVSSGGGGSYVIFGVLFLAISVMNLFVDFEYVNRAQQAAVSADAEWYCAFTIMLSLVMVYLSLLRILGRR